MPRGLKPAGIGDREVPMRLIVHGVHRTGSLSMRTALHQLGFHKCYHWVSIHENLEADLDMWVKALEAKFGDKGRKWTREDWDKLLGESQACVDVPAALFTLELAEAYPEAKIIMLNRDPEAWYESVLGSVYKTLQPAPFLDKVQSLYCAALDTRHRAWARFLTVLGKYGLPYDHGTEKDRAIAWFNKSYKDVRDAIPEERRFEFSVQDGFKPLCEFLDVPVPMIKDEKTGDMTTAPFPHVNDRASFNSYYFESKGEKLERANRQFITIMSKTIALGVMCYGGYMLWKTR